MAKTKVDFSGVESFPLIPKGKYPAKVVKAELSTNSNGNDQIAVTFEITAGKYKGARVMNYFVLIDQARWKLKEFMEAVGMKASGKVVIDCDKFKGKTCEIHTIVDDYGGDEKTRCSKYAPLGKKAKDEDLDDEDFDDDDDDAEDDDEEEEEPPKKSKKAAKKAPAKGKGKKKPEPEEDDEDDDWDEDDDDEPAPAKKAKKPAKKPAKGKKAKKPEPDDDDDDEDWDDDDDWDDED